MIRKKTSFPLYIIEIMQSLEKANFEAFVVGGCVRDLLLNREPKDWDVATNARPEEILKIFPDSVYENEFGTVGIKIKNQESKIKIASQNSKVKENADRETTEIVEVTTYRIESKYSDKRHPDAVKFAKTLEEDLSRRDFTINAMAIHGTWSMEHGTKKIIKYEVVDPFDGQKDLKDKIIRAVGKADERFNEDALRMMRAIRFAVTLSAISNFQFPISNKIPKLKLQNKKNKKWEIEEKTLLAIKKNAKNLKFISQERIRDELEKIILSPAPAVGLELLHETGLLNYIIPEIEAGWDVTQSHHHYYGLYNTVGKHLIASLEKCPSDKLEVRLAALFHDIGKPKSKRGTGENATFYAHEYLGAKITRQILDRLKFPRKVVEKTVLLVENHMFYYNVEEVGESGVRRVISKVGLENINDLIDVRIADRLGSGVPKAVPYKLRHFKFMVEKVSKDPLSVKQLKIDGHDLMRELKLPPGPKIGAILDVLLAKVIDDPKLNTKDDLFKTSRDLNKIDLNVLRKMAKARIEKEKEEEERIMKKKYWVE